MINNRIVIKKLINDELAVTNEQGQIVFNKINEKLQKDNAVIILDFSNLTTITTAFLNVSIGKLYSLGKSEELNKKIKIDSSSLNAFQKGKILRVMQNAKNKISESDLSEEIF